MPPDAQPPAVVPPDTVPIPIAEVLAAAYPLGLEMRIRFRGITARETLLIEGPAGWGEFGPFPEYDDAESAWWLAAALESAWLGHPAPVRDSVEVNATVPAVPATAVPGVLARFPGARTAKVKVAERGQSLADDLARVAEVRRHVEHVRIDANGGWTRQEAAAALDLIDPGATLQYAEQPCAAVADLAWLRARVGTPIAADESIRRADDPFAVVRAGAADIAVLKLAPLGGARRVLGIAAEIGIPVVISSALDSAVGIAAGAGLAAALPRLDYACGLGTGTFFTQDVAAYSPVNSRLPAPLTLVPDAEALRRLAQAPPRATWWRQRLERCLRLLADGHPAGREFRLH